MMQHGGWYVKKNLDRFDSLMLSLSNASDNMLALEGFMIFASADHFAMKEFGTLASLVNEARELLDKNKTEHQSGSIPEPSVPMEVSSSSSTMHI